MYDAQDSWPNKTTTPHRASNGPLSSQGSTRKPPCSNNIFPHNLPTKHRIEKQTAAPVRLLDDPNSTTRHKSSPEKKKKYPSSLGRVCRPNPYSFQMSCVGACHIYSMCMNPTTTKMLNQLMVRATTSTELCSRGTHPLSWAPRKPTSCPRYSVYCPSLYRCRFPCICRRFLRGHVSEKLIFDRWLLPPASRSVPRALQVVKKCV